MPIRRGAIGRSAAVRDPDAGAGSHHRFEGRHQPARRVAHHDPLACVLVDERLAIRHHDDPLALQDELVARIVAELPIRTPRGKRGDAEIAAIKLDVMRRINGDPPELESA